MSRRLLARPPGGAELAPCEFDDLDEHLTGDALLWLDVQTRDAEVLDELGERFGFDSAAIEDVLDVEQLPKYEVYPKHVFVVLHTVITADDRIDTHEIDCFIGRNLLVTVRSEELVGLEWLWGAVQSYPHLAEHGPDELFAQLAEVVGRRYLEVIDEFERRVDTLGDRALDADAGVLSEIQLLRREEGTIRKVLSPQRSVLAALRSDSRRPLSHEAKAVITDAFDVHNLVVENLAAARSLLTDTLDTYRGASAERQAAATTVLTVYAAIVLPLSLITSWYGMNMGNLPAADRPWGWPAVTGLMGLVAVGSWVWFVKVGLIRRPRFRSESSILAGLLAAAKAPVRPLTMLRSPTVRRGQATDGDARP